jgi:hypothetical protein
MKKLLIVMALAVMAASLIACGAKGLIGKWSVTAASGSLAEGEQLTLEFKSNGDLVMEDLMNGTSQGTQTLYYKMVDKDTIWWCESASSCTTDTALVVDYTIVNNVLTLTPPDFPDSPLVCDRMP